MPVTALTTHKLGPKTCLATSIFVCTKLHTARGPDDLVVYSLCGLHVVGRPCEYYIVMHTRVFVGEVSMQSYHIPSATSYS